MLTEKKCVPCEGGVPKLSSKAINDMLKELNDWIFDEKQEEISKNFSFSNFYKTMSFVNAIAWIANKENHHPDLKIGYNYCHVSLKTHAISGLSENDFIVAAKIDQINDI